MWWRRSQRKRLLLMIMFFMIGGGAEESIFVRPATYVQTAKLAMAEIEALAATVKVDCTVKIQSGNPPRLKVRPKDAKPKLCLVVNGSSEVASVVMMVNTVEYLMLPGNWEAFLNKAAYAIKTKRSFYLWLGDLPTGTLNDRHSVPWLPCHEPEGNTLNVYKTVALYTLLHRTVSRRILYIDADAWFSEPAFSGSATPEEYFNLSSRAFLFGNQNRIGGPKILMNGGLIFLRDGLRARRFLALWFYSRCGKHDQLPLWATLVAATAAEANHHAPTVAFPLTLFGMYKDAHANVIPALAERLKEFRRPVIDRDPANSYDGGTFPQTRILDRPLELPGILLLPSANIGSLPAVRSDLHPSAKTFVCHTRIDKVEQENQCVGKRVCSNTKCAPFLLDS